MTRELDADRVGARCGRSRGGARGRNVSRVFYGGHGIEMDGVNYVIPVDTRLERDVDVGYQW